MLPDRFCWKDQFRNMMVFYGITEEILQISNLGRHHILVYVEHRCAGNQRTCSHPREQSSNQFRF